MRRKVCSPAYRAAVAVLVAARRASGLTQKAVAERIGKPPSFLAKIELGQRRFDIVEFVEISLAVGAAPERLLAELRVKLPQNAQLAHWDPATDGEPQGQ